jgi:hypothetical protein
MVKPHSHAELLGRLIRCELPIEPTLAALREYGWDTDAGLATLGTQQMLNMLQRYLDDEITADQLTDWGDLIECHDDISYEPAYDSLLKQVIFEIANPNLNSEISQEVAQNMRHRLVAATPTI